jgi:hypothetical protein
LVSPEFAAVAECGQPLVETSEPCGKRSFVRRFIATSISAAFRAFRHVWRPDTMSLETEITPRHPFEAARTILTASGRVKIPCSMFIHLIQLIFCFPNSLACAAPGRLSKQWSDFGAAPFRAASKRSIRQRRRAPFWPSQTVWKIAPFPRVLHGKLSSPLTLLG